MSVEQHDQYLADWESRQEIAESMIPIIGKMYRANGVILKIYGRTLINASSRYSAQTPPLRPTI